MGIPRWEQLQQLTDDDLIDRYNSAAQNTVVGTGFYRDELHRRALERESVRMTKLTRDIRRLTALIFVLTLAVAVLTAMAVTAG